MSWRVMTTVPKIGGRTEILLAQVIELHSDGCGDCVKVQWALCESREDRCGQGRHVRASGGTEDGGARVHDRTGHG